MEPCIPDVTRLLTFCLAAKDPVVCHPPPCRLPTPQELLGLAELALRIRATRAAIAAAALSAERAVKLSAGPERADLDLCLADLRFALSRIPE